MFGKKYFLGIDDTDNKFSRGTGFRARHLCKLINTEKLGNVLSITRHQLFFHPGIPYTSQNSSACIELETFGIEDIKLFCQSYLKCECAPDSDVGLCIADTEKIDNNIINWGQKAKTKILTKSEAYDLSAKSEIYLESFLGTKDGVIGALAAVGLRKSGNDGRFIWLSGKELREFSGIYSTEELYNSSLFDEVVSKNNDTLKAEDRINVTEWIRPVLRNSKITVIVDQVLNNKDYEWQIASKEYIKSISN